MAFKLRKNLATVLNAQAANGFGTTIECKDFKDLLIQVSATGNPMLTLRVQGSLSDTPPDFTAAQSATNHWDYISIFNIEDGNLIAGNTGLVFTGTNDFSNLIVNTDALTYLNCQVSGYSAGAVTVKLQRNTID